MRRAWFPTLVERGEEGVRLSGTEGCAKGRYRNYRSPWRGGGMVYVDVTKIKFESVRKYGNRGLAGRWTLCPLLV